MLDGSLWEQLMYESFNRAKDEVIIPFLVLNHTICPAQEYIR